MSKVVRDLYLHDLRSELARDTPFHAVSIPWFDSLGFASVLGEFPSWRIRARGDSTVWWNHYDAAAERLTQEQGSLEGWTWRPR